MICISCNNEHDEKYCPNCGERNGVRKITVSSIMGDTFASITDMDKGFLFNLKALFLNPQKIITDYINGKRKGVLNPISFLLLSITFYLIISAVFRIPKELGEIMRVPEGAFQETGMRAGLFLKENIKFFWMFSIVPLGVALKPIFKKYNYVEYLAISSLIIGQATMVGTISYLFFRFPLIYDPGLYLAMLWLMYRIFKGPNNKIETFVISIVALVIFIMLLFVILTLIGVATA